MSLALVTALVLGQFVPGSKLELVTEPEAAPARPFFWTTATVLGRGADQSFVIKGTRAGRRYRFQATGVCRWEPRPIFFNSDGQPIVRFPRADHILGIDFRVQIGTSAEKRILNVGSGRSEQSTLDFVAEHDDVQIRVFENWDLPKGVTCSIGGFEVMPAPTE